MITMRCLAAVIISLLIGLPTFAKSGVRSTSRRRATSSTNTRSSSAARPSPPASQVGRTRLSAVPRTAVPRTTVPRARSLRRCPSCQRDSRGKIQRSTSARHEFQHLHPCPSTGSAAGGCPGYVVDHIRPLKRGGVDSPGNMQWQTTTAAKAKDRVE